MRCPDCNKFCAIDSEQDPEIDLDVADDGEVSGTVQISNSCADCGTEVTTTSFDLVVGPDNLVAEDGQPLTEALAAVAAYNEANPNNQIETSLEVANEDGSRTSRTVGKGRGTRTYYGAEVTMDVTLAFEQEHPTGVSPFPLTPRTFSGSWSDEVQASAMEQAY